VEKFGSALYVVAIAFLAFVAGAFVMLLEVFPADPLRHGYAAGQALIAKQRMSRDKYVTDLWREARTPDKGVTTRTAAALEGYTLYTSGDSARARLIALDGTLVHEWHRPYGTVWQPGGPVKKPQRDELVFMEKARVLPDGGLLAIYEAAGDTPWGYGMVKLDRAANVLWTYLEQTHHDFDVAPDGRILVLTHAFTSEKIEGLGKLARPRLDDFAVVLSPDGKEEHKVSLTKALAHSPYRTFLHAMPVFSTADPLHTNTIEYVTPARARMFPHARAGDLVLSFRDLGLIAVLDLEREEIVWASRGPWVGQHDPSVLDDGHLLVFDNLGGFDPGNDARVLEVDARTLGIVWQYAGTRARPFSSPLRSSAQRLRNGNTLITESDGGRLFEVSRAGEVVWEFVNPIRGGADERYVPVVSWGQRVTADALDADFAAVLAERAARAGAPE
jgi:hypothetical protein